MAEPTSTSGTTIPGVELGAPIGRGGFATVYRGRQITLDRDVAVKIDSRSLDDDRNRRRFLREATAAGRISTHPHVVSLVDVGTTADHRPYLVMELCENGSLADVLRRDGPFRVDDAVEIGLAISSALGAAHAAGVLHRDVKPGNILVDAYGTPRLTDFGLAALPVPGEDLSVTVEALTPAYAPPEAFDQAPPSRQGDVWSLGATLHALIAGQPPRTNPDGTPASIVDVIARTREPFVDPQIPGSDLLMPVIARATAFARADRYADGVALHTALAEVRDQIRDRVRSETGRSGQVLGGPEAAFVTALRPSPADGRTPGRTTPRRRLLVLAAIPILLLGGLGGYAVRAATVPVGLAAAPPAAASPTPATSPTPPAAPTPTAPALGICWSGIVTIGDRTTARKVPCSSAHAWETFAGGILDPATPSSGDTDVAADPVVTRTCDQEALRAYVGPDRKGTFEWRTLPPSEVAFAQGDRGFSCLASEQGRGLVTGSIKG